MPCSSAPTASSSGHGVGHGHGLVRGHGDLLGVAAEGVRPGHAVADGDIRHAVPDGRDPPAPSSPSTTGSGSG